MARVLLLSRMRVERSKAAWRMCMPLINVVVALIVVGVLLWLVNNYIPMDAKIKNILNIVVVIAVVLWLLSAFGVLGPLSSYRVGR
jgi:hydrogenase-4 membrane subunit HyfE